MFMNPTTPEIFADRMTGIFGPYHVRQITDFRMIQVSADAFGVILEYTDKLPIGVRPFSRTTLKSALTRFVSPRGKHAYAYVYEVKSDPFDQLKLLAAEFPALQWYAATDFKWSQFVIVSGTSKTKSGAKDLLNFKQTYHGTENLPKAV